MIPSDYSPAVRAILGHLSLGQYAARFDDEGYDDADFMLTLAKRSELKAVGKQELGMKPGHAHKFVQACNRAIGHLRVGCHSRTTPAPAPSDELKKVMKFFG